MMTRQKLLASVLGGRLFPAADTTQGITFRAARAASGGAR
jgi:hypothetical protein